LREEACNAALAEQSTESGLSSLNIMPCSFLSPAETPDELGRLGPYRVLKVLGAGGVGIAMLDCPQVAK